MHYLLSVKEADYPYEDELESLLDGFVPVFDDEEVGWYGVWEPWPYENFEEYKAEENIKEADTLEEAVNATAWYRIGEDNKVYEKVSIHCDWYDVLEVATYADILKKYEVVGAFVENGEFYYTKVMDGDRDCPFAGNERVYAIECHI